MSQTESLGSSTPTAQVQPSKMARWETPELTTLSISEETKLIAVGTGSDLGFFAS